MEKIITKSFARLMGRGTHRGFITHEELNKSLLFIYPTFITETFCNSCVEAASCGCNIISTNI